MEEEIRVRSSIVRAAILLFIILIVYPPLYQTSNSQPNNIRFSQITPNLTSQPNTINLEPVGLSPNVITIGMDNETGEVIISYMSSILCTKSLKGMNIFAKGSIFRKFFDLPGEGKVGLYIAGSELFYYIDCKNTTFDIISFRKYWGYYPDVYVWNDLVLSTRYKTRGDLIGNVIDLIVAKNKTITANYTIITHRNFPEFQLSYSKSILLAYIPFNSTSSFLLAFNTQGELIFNKTIDVDYVEQAHGFHNIPGVLLIESNYITKTIKLTTFYYENNSLFKNTFTIPGNYTFLKSKLFEDSTLLLVLNNSENGNLVAKWIKFNKTTFSIIRDIDLGVKSENAIVYYGIPEENVIVIKNGTSSANYIILTRNGVINLHDDRLSFTGLEKAYYLEDLNTVLLNLYYPSNDTYFLYIEDLDTGQEKIVWGSYLKTKIGNIIYLKNYGIYRIKDNASIELYYPYLRIAFGILPVNETLTARVVIGVDDYVHLEFLDNKLNVVKTVSITKTSELVSTSYNSIFAYLASYRDNIYIFLSGFNEDYSLIEGYMYNMSSDELVKYQEYVSLPSSSNYFEKGNGIVVFDYPSIRLLAINLREKLYPIFSTLKLWPSETNTTILIAKNSIRLAIYHGSINAFSLIGFSGGKLLHKSMFSAIPLTWLHNDTFLIAYYLPLNSIVVLDNNGEIRYMSRGADFLPGRNFIAWLHDNGTIFCISENGVFTYNKHKYNQAVSSPYSDYILAEENRTLYLLYNGEETPIGKLPQDYNYILMETTIPYVYETITGLFYRLNLSFLYNQTTPIEHIKWQIIPETPLNLSIVYMPPSHIYQCVWNSTTIRIVGEEPLPDNYTINLTLYYRNGETNTRKITMGSGEMTIPINEEIQDLLGIMIDAKDAQGIFIPAACPANDYKLLNSTQIIDISPISAYIYRNETIIKLKHDVQIEQSYSLELGTSDDNWNLLFWFRTLTFQVNPSYRIQAITKSAILTIVEETTGNKKTIQLNTSLNSSDGKLCLNVVKIEDIITITLPYLGNNNYKLSYRINPPTKITYSQIISFGNISGVTVQLVINGEILSALKQFEKNITVNAKMLEYPESSTTTQGSTVLQNIITSTPEQTNNYTNTSSTSNPERGEILKTIITIVVLSIAIVGVLLFLRRR